MRYTLILNWLMTMLLLLATLSSVSAAEQRTALVIGNGSYNDAPLQNPVNDATDVAQTLQELGFVVNLQLNVSLEGMDSAIDEFRKALRQGGVGVFYFAGHGVQVGGQNYLIPIGADVSEEIDVKYKAVQAQWVLESMLKDREDEVNIVILDACRDNPLTRSWRSTRRGLAKMDTTGGILIAYATAPGQVALDGEGRNSPYTKALLRHLPQPGLSIERMFKKVRKTVWEETGHEQRPWEESSLLEDFQFAALPPEGPSPPGTPPTLAPKPPPTMTEKQVTALLSQAQRQMAAKRLTTPAGDNAWETYQEVLRISPGHEEAEEGMKGIREQYVQWAEAAEQKGHWAKARRYYDRALKVNPNDETLMTALRRVEVRTSPKEPSVPPRLSPEFLTSRSWEFRHGEGDVISPRVRLQPDGTIIGIDHPNESAWGLEEGILVFYHESGRPSTRFTEIRRKAGKIILTGRLLLPGHQPIVIHVLEASQ